MFVGSYCDTWEGRCGVCAEHGGNWASALGFRQEVKVQEEKRRNQPLQSRQSKRTRARRMERKGPGTEGQGEGPVYCGAGTNQTTGDHKWKARPL